MSSLPTSTWSTADPRHVFFDLNRDARAVIEAYGRFWLADVYTKHTWAVCLYGVDEVRKALPDEPLPPKVFGEGDDWPGWRWTTAPGWE